MTAAGADLGTVYVLCFARPFHGANGRHIGARHYIGWTCEPEPTRRVAQHLSGHGSPLVRAVVAAGIGVDLVLALPGDRYLERRFHWRHGTRVCPRCKTQRPPRPRQLRLATTRSKPAPRRGRRPTPLWRGAAA